MKVVALGGSGGMGRYAVRTAIKYDFIDEIVIADLDGEAAAGLASSLGPKARAAEVDVRDTEALGSLLSGADIVLNTVGPFFRFGVSTLRAAIQAKCHYLDINDDWEPTLAMLELDSEARAAGVTAVIGMGASPGLSNLLAVKAIGELDQAEEIYTVWDMDATKPEEIGPEPCAATVHGIHQLTGKIRVFENGRFVDRRPIRRVDLDYPGLGRRSAWTIGHPEAVTLPLTYPQLRRSANLLVTSRSNILATRYVTWLVNLRLVSVERAARWAEQYGSAEVKEAEDYWRVIEEGGEIPLPPLFALARGTRNSKPASAAVMLLSAPAGGMAGATGVPLTVALSLFGRGHFTKHGVFAPEAAVDPDAFFSALAPLCSPPMIAPAALHLTSRSWEDTRLVDSLQQLVKLGRLFRPPGKRTNG